LWLGSVLLPRRPAPVVMSPALAALSPFRRGHQQQQVHWKFNKIGLF
jgi:hypothetical protein